MAPLDAGTTALGLRERKKQQTREKIARVALKLFAERGYDETTLADIAEAADVSPRTIFAYYEGKEDILFCEEGAFIDRLKQTLDEPPGRNDHGRRHPQLSVRDPAAGRGGQAPQDDRQRQS